MLPNGTSIRHPSQLQCCLTEPVYTILHNRSVRSLIAGLYLATPDQHTRHTLYSSCILDLNYYHWAWPAARRCRSMLTARTPAPNATQDTVRPTTAVVPAEGPFDSAACPPPPGRCVCAEPVLSPCPVSVRSSFGHPVAVLFFPFAYDMCTYPCSPLEPQEHITRITPSPKTQATCAHIHTRAQQMQQEEESLKHLPWPEYIISTRMRTRTRTSVSQASTGQGFAIVLFPVYQTVRPPRHCSGRVLPNVEISSASPACVWPCVWSLSPPPAPV